MKRKEARKYKITERKNGTKRYSQDFNCKCKTDQSMKNQCDINHLMKQYAKTGMLPQLAMKEPFYADLTEVPTFLEAHRIVQEARNLFYDLPSEVRKLMNHDPANLEEFIKNPENIKICEKHGLIKVVKKEVKQSKVPEIKEETLKEKVKNVNEN